MSTPEISTDLVPEVRDFLLTSFTKTVSEIAAKAHLVPQIQTIANDNELLRGLIERMQRGSKADVRSYVDEIFEIFPFGLRTSIVYSLTEIFKEWQLHQRARKRQRKSDVAELFSHEVCGDLVKKWKSGTFSPSELYEGISSAVVNGSMEPQLAKRMVDLTLQDAGYIRTYNDRADFDKTERFRADAKGFDLVNLQSVAASLDGSEIEMMTFGGISATVSSSKHAVVSRSYPSSYNMTTKGKQLWWRHEGGGDQLFFLQPENATSRPLLLIGGSLKLDNGDLDIETVVGVDVCPHISSDDTLSATILVDGQWLGELDRSTRGMCDGASEVGGDDDNDNNSTGSGDEEESPRVGRSLGATQTVKRRYYCVFISIINGSVIVRYVTPIHKSLVLDQHPSMILSLRPAVAVVGGTNGLLGIVDATVFSLYSSLTPSATTTSHTSASYQSAHRDFFLDDSSNSPLMRDDEASLNFNLRLPTVSNLSDLAGRVKIGSVITLKGGVGSSYTALSMPGGRAGGGDRDSETSESVKGDEQPQSFFPLTVDSFARDILQNSQSISEKQFHNNNHNNNDNHNNQQAQNENDRKIKQERRTSLSRMRDTFASSRSLPMATLPEASNNVRENRRDNVRENGRENVRDNVRDNSRDGDDERDSNNPYQNMNKMFTLQSGGEVLVTHAADACITALSYSGEESCVFASGDSAGVICLWRVMDECTDWEPTGLEDRGSQFRLVRLAAMPLQMGGVDQSSTGEREKLNLGSRISSLFVSASGRHVAVGLWDRLLLVAVGQSQEEGEETTSEDESMQMESQSKISPIQPSLPSMYIRTSLDIITGCRAVYSVVFRSPQLHVWRLTNTPLAHPFSPSKTKRPLPTQAGTRIPVSREPRPPIRSRSSTTRDREFRFFPDILRRSATPSTCTSRTSSIFSLSSPSSPLSTRRFSISSAPSTPIPSEPQSPWVSTALPAERSSSSFTGNIWGSMNGTNINQNNQMNQNGQNGQSSGYNNGQNGQNSGYNGNNGNGGGGYNGGYNSDGTVNPTSQESEDLEQEDRIEEIPIGVTVTSWLHPNVDCFHTRFGMPWNDHTFFGGSFSEADDAASTNSSVRGGESDCTSNHTSTHNTSSRQRSFSDCPTLPPTGSSRSNKRGPQTVGQYSTQTDNRSDNRDNRTDNRMNTGIADNDTRFNQPYTTTDRYINRNYQPPVIQTRGDLFLPSSSNSTHRSLNTRRYSVDISAQPAHYTGGLLSLQTCGHAVHQVQSASQSTGGLTPPVGNGWYNDDLSENSSGTQSRCAMELVTRDDTDNSQDSSQSSTPQPQPDDSYMPPYIPPTFTPALEQTFVPSLSQIFPPAFPPTFPPNVSTISRRDGASDVRVSMANSSSNTTTPTTNYSTPDMTPLHSPYRGGNSTIQPAYRSPDHMLAHLSLSASDYRSLCLHTMLPENSHHASSSSVASLSGCLLTEMDFTYMRAMMRIFKHESSKEFQSVKKVLAIFCAALQPPSASLIAAALEEEMCKAAVVDIFLTTLSMLFNLKCDVDTNQGGNEWGYAVISLTDDYSGLSKWLTSTTPERRGKEFWIDVSIGHNFLCALYLKYCGNKSVAVEHPWQEYLKTHGPSHLRRASRGLRLLTRQIRKIDETANIKGTLPRQLGFIVGLQEIYARRVGLIGRLPHELGELDQLRVLSMGNNQLCGELPASLGNLKHLQRIVLHQNKLTGQVPASLGKLGCIVNLAGNVGLEHGPDVPETERDALVAFFHATKGSEWTARHCWGSREPVSRWYKVGVLLSHVHSIVMSSNGMVGHLPEELQMLTQLRMVELATMTGLVGPIPTQLCSLITLRRLCICRCGLTGEIPAEIGQLIALEELQLFGNHLSGAIPASLGNLVELKLLSLGEYTGGNDFTPRPLPACFASLQNLEALFMANCHVRGPLPSWIGELTELRQLDLQRNSLSGAIPTAIGKLHNLLYLNVKDNERLGGALPVAQLASLTKLNRLSLVHCNFERAEEAVGELQSHLPRCKIWV